MVNSCPNREEFALLQAAHARAHQGVVARVLPPPGSRLTLAGSRLPRDIAHRDGSTLRITTPPE